MNQIDRVKEQKITIRNWLESDDLRRKIAQALPKHVTADRWMRTLLTAVQRTPKLMQCSQESLFLACMNLSATGLEPDGYHAHLIPYNNRRANRVDCNLIIDYKGLIRLVRNSPEVADVYAEAVYENDDFSIELGTEKRIVHKPTVRGSRGEMIGVYSVAVMADGKARSFDFMTVADVEKIRSRSQSADSGPWRTDYTEMARKTVIRRHCKYLPLTREVHAAVSAEDGEPERVMKNVTPQGNADFLKPGKEETPERSLLDDIVEGQDASSYAPPVDDDDDLDFGGSTVPPDPSLAARQARTTASKPKADAKPTPEAAGKAQEAAGAPAGDDPLLSSVEKLLAAATADSVPHAALRSYAEARKLDIDRNEDAQRILNAWKSIRSLIVA